MTKKYTGPTKEYTGRYAVGELITDSEGRKVEVYSITPSSEKDSSVNEEMDSKETEAASDVVHVDREYYKTQEEKEMQRRNDERLRKQLEQARLAKKLQMLQDVYLRKGIVI
jgi:hypothetical protein